MITALWRWLRGKDPATEIPLPLWQGTLARYPFLAALSPAERTELKHLCERFLQEKEFSGAQGLKLSDAMCVAIAAQACLPILALGLEAYRGWVGIVIYPGEFVVPRQLEDDDGVVHEFDDVISGEAWAGGPVLLSWQDAATADDDYNVVIHEFAHKLDMVNGDADGVPAMHSGLTTAEWESTLLAAYEDFCQRLDRGEEMELDPYAAQDPAEFFAVLSESFFCMPHRLRAAYPALYALFQRYYRQDPAARTDV